ncbi:LexA family transcriptional regulator [Microbacterium sp. 77mftsu3.1]|uniref:LexA family protein n=1 Tax=Microbacterium sp. 77mftsu3.1 TaxID=1761802 RepID=UPI00036B69D0|nr:translesion error-prone DNA polymerase V autoproteolytic subunit [Microbacterium sp. 77mftsu3.1]SDH55323.1 SOS response UmuD protein. Serine peptidase. MEROPS family S24 [Microbacterium sp. 77mftsu3.1]
MYATVLGIATSELARSPIRVSPVAVPAGFPSPAQDYYDGELSLDDHLITDRAATFIVRVAGHSMHDAGIWDGDELLVDRSKTPRDGDVVVAILDGELTVKRLRVTPTGVVLQADNAEHPDIVVPELSDLQIFGVATFGIRHLRG